MFISDKVRFCTGFGFHFYCIGCHESLGYLIINVTERLSYLLDDGVRKRERVCFP